MGHEGELTQVMVNLLVNALEATPGSGKVTVEAMRHDEWVQVKVIDNGRGMDEATLRRVFEPFFTDKPQRDQRGTGLGLSVSHAIITQHGGRLTAASNGPGRGSVFAVELPAAAGK
jgi:signal transduction histidine kinase